MTIKAPRFKGNYSERFIDCQIILEDQILEIISDAKLAGWTENEVLMSLTVVVDNAVIEMNAKARVGFEGDLVKFANGKKVES